MKRIVSVLLCAIMLLSLVACGTHEHTFDKTVQSQQYLKEAGCADKKAVYFYSCDCGEKGTETFEGDFGTGHNYAPRTTAAYFIEEATETTPAKYYYSCSSCGVKSEETFTHGKLNSERAAVGSKAKEALDGKKILIAGCSYNYYGKMVMRLENETTAESARLNDMGYFYELCKQNGAEVSVTNWCFGGHDLADLLGTSCAAGKACGNGFNHLAELTDFDYDYVSLLDTVRPEKLSMEAYIAELKSYMKLFTDVNPDCKFIYSIPCGAYWYKGERENPADRLEGVDYAAEIAKLDNVIVMDWGRLVYDLIKGNTTVPGSTFTYNEYSLKAGDNYHPNLLSGYINSLMTYCVITGETAVGQPTNLENGMEGDATFTFQKDNFTAYYYLAYGKESNFIDIMDSATEMEGIQKLIDRYIDMQTYLYY